MTKGNELILDLEKKLNLYSNHVGIEKEVDAFENNQCEDLINIIFIIFEKKTLKNEIEIYNNKYNDSLVIEENKIKYSKPNNFSKIGVKIFEKLYFKNKETVLLTWLEIIKIFPNYGLWYWFEEVSSIEEVKEFFLDEIKDYIIENKEFKENLIKRFEDYELNKPMHRRNFDVLIIPKEFDNFFEIYKFFKKYEHEDFFFERSYKDYKHEFIRCLIKHETLRSHYYNEDSYPRINRLLIELKDDYFIIGDILSSRDIRFNTYLLSNSKYCLYGFLNIVTKDIYLNNLMNEDTFDYNKQWLDMISNQTVNIFIPTLLNNDKNNLIQIVFNSINYLVQSYSKSKKDLISFSLEKFLNKFASSILKEDKLLFNLVINDLVEHQIKLLEQNENIKEESYFLLNWYLKNLTNREKIDDIDYSKLKEDITKAIFQNIKKIFNKSIESKHFYINSSQIIDNMDFNLFYELSSEDLKNSWINILDFRQLKTDLKTNDRYYISSLGKFYLEILILFYSKTYDEKLEKTIIDIVLKLGIEEELGIFFSNSENKFFDSFLKILNNFKDENYELFINKVIEIKDIKNLLHIYHTTISSERKKVLETKIENFDFKSEEFHNYNDLQNSINFALNSGFDKLVNTLINIYKELLEKDEKKILNRENLEKQEQKIDEKKDNAFIININSNEILNAKIQAFERLKYRKDLVDIYHEKIKTREEKLVAINNLQLPQINIKDFRNREVKAELENYRRFVIALINLDEKPLYSYDILKELSQKNPKNHLYLINMLRAYYEVYKDDKNKKEKFEYIITEYNKYEKEIGKYEKELYDYHILLTIYNNINDFKSFVELWNELPKAYFFDLYIAKIRCQFLQKNNQSTEALNYLEELKVHHKNFNEDDEKELVELEENIKKEIIIEIKERIFTNVVLEKTKSLDKYEAKNYWLHIKDMNDESHAHIFANQENLEEYIKDIMLNIAEELLERKINLQRVNINNKLELEDIINDWVGSLLGHRKNFLGWKVLDQKRGGVSGGGEGVGEKDLVVKNPKNKNLFLFEAFKNKTEEHLNKLDGYNASGCKLILVFVYTKEKDFIKYSNNYKEKISKMNYKGFDKMVLPLNIEKVDNESSKINLYKDIRQKNKEKTIIYHYLLDFS